MYIKGKYRANDTMSQLICDDHLLLLVISRFGISLGFANKTIKEVCDENNVELNTFLAVANLILRAKDNNYKPSIDDIDIECLVSFLRNSHSYFINVRLPKIRKKLISIVGDDKISSLIIRYFDDYVLQIGKHFDYEDSVLFPYIDKLKDNIDADGFTVDKYSERHDHIDEPLTEFKDVIIQYWSTENSEELNEIIYDLLNSANDLLLHNMCEDRLLVPIISKMEKKYGK